MRKTKSLSISSEHRSIQASSSKSRLHRAAKALEADVIQIKIRVHVGNRVTSTDLAELALSIHHPFLDKTNFEIRNLLESGGHVTHVTHVQSTNNVFDSDLKRSWSLTPYLTAVDDFYSKF
jgi:hypothetical protein